MTEIPEDIKAKATTVCMDIYGGFHPPEYVEWIAEAILAERHRCARVAYSIGNEYGKDESGWADCSIAIRDAIRSGRT